MKNNMNDNNKSPFALDDGGFVARTLLSPAAREGPSFSGITGAQGPRR